MTSERTADRIRVRHRRRAGGIVFGLTLVVLGLIWTLDRMDAAPIHDVGRLWPLAVVGAGAAKLWDSWGTSATGSGMGLMMTGLWFLVVNFGIFGLTAHNAWPLLIVGAGVSIMWRAFLEDRGPLGARGIDGGDAYLNGAHGNVNGGGGDRKESSDGR